MSHTPAESIYMNLFILAVADGRLDEREQRFLEAYANAAGISDQVQEDCRQYVLQNQMTFAQIEDAEQKRNALAFLARMVRVDDEFHEKEQLAYITMGKALGYEEEALGDALRTYWNQDPTFPSPPPVVHSSTVSTGTILVVMDDVEDLDKLKKSADAYQIQYSTLAELTTQGVQADAPFLMILFQVAADSKSSKERLDYLKRQFPNTPVAFTARRDQAPQIGFLLECGADKCFVKPLYTNELNKALRKLQTM